MVFATFNHIWRPSIPILCHGQFKSSDLIPIENLWRELKRRVELLTPINRAELKAAVGMTWAEIDVSFCQNLIESIAARIKAVITARGGVTKFDCLNNSLYYRLFFNQIHYSYFFFKVRVLFCLVFGKETKYMCI